MEFIEQCRAVCVSAAAECNRSGALWICIPESISFSAATKNIDLCVRLLRPDGQEPEGNLRDEEFFETVSAFRTVLDRKLQAAQLDATLGSVLAPERYYPPY